MSTYLAMSSVSQNSLQKTVDILTATLIAVRPKTDLDLAELLQERMDSVLEAEPRLSNEEEQVVRDYCKQLQTVLGQRASQ